MKREVVVAEIEKSKNDVYRVTIAGHPEGHLIHVAAFHRHKLGLTAIPGRSISIRPDRAGPLIDALRDAQAQALNDTAAKELGWLMTED